MTELGRVILSSAFLPVGDEMVFAIRAGILSYRTHTQDMEHCVEDLRSATDALLNKVVAQLTREKFNRANEKYKS